MEKDERKQVEEIRLIPFTEQELEDVQLTLLSKMVQLSHDMHEGKVSASAVENELNTLERVTEKVSRYCGKSGNGALIEY